MFKQLANNAFSGFAIPTLLALGSILIAVDQWLFAEGAFVVAGLWTVFWLCFQPYRNGRFDVAILAITALVVSGLIYATERYRIHRILSANRGLLSPSDDSTNGCDPIRKTIFLGDLAFATSFFPQTLISVHDPSSSRDIPILVADLQNELLSISATVSSEDGRIIARIKDNEWIVNPNNIFYKENRDESSLKVIDQKDNIALDIRYSNNRVINVRKIRLRFQKHLIEGDERGVVINGEPKIARLCLASDVPVTFINVR